MKDMSFVNDILLQYDILNEEEAILIVRECESSNVTPEFFMLACRILEKEAIVAINYLRKGVFKLTKQQVRVLFNFDALFAEITRIRNKEKRAKLPNYPVIGETISNFVLKEVLGKGATAMVYKAIHKVSGQTVVVKVLSPQLTVSDDNIQNRFIQEGKNSAKLDHPNLVRIIEAGQFGNYAYIAMEHFDSIVLDKALEVKKFLEPIQVIKIAIEISKALNYSYENFSLIHRDIKPGNIILTNTSKVKLMDFGLARIINEPGKYQTISGQIYETLYYMSPEQIIDSDSIDFKADMYSLGCTLYHLLTGTRPFESNRLIQLINMHIMHVPYPPDFLAPDRVTPALSKIVMRLLEKVPNKRYLNYDELIFDLKDAGQEYVDKKEHNFQIPNKVFEKAISLAV